MATFARRRPGTIPPIAGDSVRIADHHVDLDRYEEIVTSQFEIVLARLGVRQSVTPLLLNQAAHALICGRTLATDHCNNRVFQSTYYCRYGRLCKCCYATNAKARAAVQLDEPAAYMGMRLLHFVFTSPAVSTKQEELEWTARLHRARQGLLDATTTWKRRKGETCQIGHYVIGLHTKPSEGSSLQWPHLHLAMLVHPLCPVCSPGGLHAWYTRAYERALDVWPAPLVLLKDIGILATVAVNRSGRRRNVTTVKRACNLFAYASRNTEHNDTPDTVAARDQLFSDCGITTSYTRSRRRSGTKPLKRAAAPHAFPPDVQGEKRTLIYPLDGTDYREIPPSQHHAEQHQLLLRARSILTQLYPATQLNGPTSTGTNQ